MAIDVELKKKILSLVRENEEFRYALAGLLGLDTILFELKKLREDFLVFVKEQEKKWEEAFKRFEAIEKTLIEHTKILEEHTKILQEHSKRLEELSRAVAQLHVTLGRLGGR
jgi:septal ring factor EnvC (AmiA/AmiB activator)